MSKALQLSLSKHEGLILPGSPFEARFEWVPWQAQDEDLI
jgi:hypothetical protein